MMPSVGNDTFHTKIWNQLECAFDAGHQSGKLIALLLGVSGVGKTKTAYDIGKKNAFAIITRIVERDTLTMPWQTFSSILNNVVVLGNPSLSEKCSLVTCLQFALDVSISAAKLDAFKNLVENRQHRGECDTNEATDLVMKEVVLRCQRNGLAYSQVNTRFQKLLHEALRQTGFITKDGVFAVQLSYVTDILLKEVTRARKVWGETSKIVWFYDEIQASLTMICSDQNLFAGVFKSLIGSHVPPDTPIEDDRPHCNLFYGILVAIRIMLQVVSHGHVLLGNNMKLSPELLDRNSPAQGCCVSYEEKFHLDEGAILKMLGTYLTDAAVAAVSRSQVRLLCGRPLFISHFWTCMISSARKLTDKFFDIGEVVNNALHLAYDSAIVDAKFRIDRMWSDYTPSVHSASNIRGLMALLYHSIVMNSGGGGVQKMQEELKEAIVRGILNCIGNEDLVSLEGEPITKRAFMLVGHQRLVQKTDGIMELLAARVTMPMGSERCDFGEVLEACFPWYLVRECIIAAKPVCLRSLLTPFLTAHASCELFADRLEDYDVILNCGLRWDSDDHDHSPLSTLKTNPDCLIHHPNDNMAGPDTMHVAIDRRNRKRTVPVFYQLKNRQTGTISGAMESLNLGRMHPNRYGVIETAAHCSMRGVLEADSNWLEPIRVLVTCKPFESAVLHHVAWFNIHQLKRSPIILLTVNKRNLGVDIMQETNTTYCAPRDWKILWPTPVKHSNLQCPVESIQSNCSKVSLSVKISWKLLPLQRMTKSIILDAVSEQFDRAEVTNAVRSRTSHSVTITFARIVDAFKIVYTKKFRIGDKEMFCEFA